MAKGVYACIDGVSRNVKKIPVCIDGVSRNTKTGYACIDGVSRQFFGGGSEINSLTVGEVVYLNVNGVPKEFIIVNQGRPYYGGGSTSLRVGQGLDGTWLLMKDIYVTMAMGNNAPPYRSNVKTYLNGDFFNLLDTGVQNIIHEVQYLNGCKIFLLSYDDIGFKYAYTDTWQIELSDGHAPLEYFRHTLAVSSHADRIAYYNGAATEWWTSSFYYNNSTARRFRVSNTGAGSLDYGSATSGVRPALIIPSTTLVDGSNNIIA